MSAYIVEKNHIQYIMAAVQSPTIRFDFTYEDEDGNWVTVAKGDFDATAKLGNILWQANAVGVNARYNDNEAPEELTSRDVQLFPIDPMQLLRSLDCLEYQSCDAASWQDSVAAGIVRRLIKLAYQSLPGYTSAIWGAPEPTWAKVLTVKASALN